MVLIAVTISRQETEWSLPGIPWFNFVKDEKVPMLEQGGIEGPEAKSYQKNWTRGHPGPRRYITYLAKKRNRAVELALEKYPETTDVMMCDTYYTNQIAPLKVLTRDYQRLQEMKVTSALGGATWGLIRTRPSDFFRPRRKEWYDKWGVPDLTFTPYGWKPEKDKVLGGLLNPPLSGLFHTSSLSGISIWPRSAWDKGARYGVFDDLHGCEHNYFFEHSGIPRYTDFNAEFYRRVSYSFLKALRCSVNLGRFIQK